MSKKAKRITTYIVTTSNLSNIELDVTSLNTLISVFCYVCGYRTAGFSGFGKGGSFLFILHFLHWASCFFLSLIMLVRRTLSIEPFIYRHHFRGNHAFLLLLLLISGGCFHLLLECRAFASLYPSVSAD